MTKKEIMAAAARAVREARELMNHGGKHWIKGAEHRIIDPMTHVPGDRDGVHPAVGWGGESAYCSIGALKQKTGERVAFIALADAMAPALMKEERERINRDADYEEGACDPWSNFDKKKYIEDETFAAAEDIIIGFNDDNTTEWADVRDAFTAAARRLADRARKLR